MKPPTRPRISGCPFPPAGSDDSCVLGGDLLELPMLCLPSSRSSVNTAHHLQITRLLQAVFHSGVAAAPIIGSLVREIRVIPS